MTQLDVLYLDSLKSSGVTDCASCKAELKRVLFQNTETETVQFKPSTSISQKNIVTRLTL